MGIIDGKESDERNQMGQNDEDRLTDDIYILKLITLSSKRDRYNIGK